MNKQKFDIDAIRKLHQEGNLEEAKQSYLNILKKDPHHIEALHELGILSAQQNDFSAAVDYLQTALEYQPDSISIQINLANALKALGLFNQSAALLHSIVDLYPKHSHALNNLGAVYFAQGKVKEAIKFYRLALHEVPDYINAYYNLGLALTKIGKIDDAIETYETLLTHAPQHAPGLFQLGCLLLEEKKISEAISCFQRIEKDHPHHFETQTNLATCYLKQGLLNEAKAHYLKALALLPDDLQVLFNLAVINMQQGYTDSAIQHYQHIIKFDPDHFAAHNNLAVAFLAKNHPSFALQHFREALRIQPNNEAIRYMVDVLSKDKSLHAAPSEYIKTLFDAYADHYEPHLLQSLEYQLPDLLLQSVKKVFNLQPATHVILDLGCGTGLCGIPFKPFAKTLIGVDLSAKMLEIAKQKDCYDELIEADLITFLATKKNIYDLIIAGDVFVYRGDLAEIFSTVKDALCEKGIFTFNTEIHEKENNYTINQAGRFAHQKNYLKQLAQQNQLQVLFYQKIITRQQHNEPVYGHIFVLGKNK